MLRSALFVLCSLPVILAVNFPYENDQLTEVEARSDPSIRFAARGGRDIPIEECRAIPGDSEWPSESDWSRFNQTLGGVLLKPRPLGIVCYAGPQYDAKRCEDLKRTWTSMNIHSNDPISVMSQWSSGSSCVTTSDPNSNCTQGGYPVYVVNATTVRHVQLAVNFARNNNIRLVIKNSGHDFNGKSVGGHALSIWVHNMKAFTYHPNYSTAEYSGRAVAYSGGFQAQDAQPQMSRYNMTFLIAGGPTVGIAGGFLQGGGHSGFTSYYGLATDLVLSIQAVTADGRFVTVDANTNPDLFWAFRGGGGGTFGVITSVIVKAFPQTPQTSGSITFTTVPPRTGNQTALDLETFWKGVKAYWGYCTKICDAGGLGYNFIRHTPYPNSPNTTGYTFTTSVSLPRRSIAEYRAFIRPLLEELNSLGIPVPIPASLPVKRFEDPYSPEALLLSREIFKNHPQHNPSALNSRAIGDTTGNTLIGSRFFLRSNTATPSALTTMSNAIRHFVEKESNGGGYTFHGINYSPTLEVSGHPNNSIHPAYRKTIMHAEGYSGDAWFDTVSPVVDYATQKSRHDRLQSYFQTWRDVTPGSGSYINEGDAQEPDFKDAFWGRENYAKLEGIKREWDPSGLFYAVGGVGSDWWFVDGREAGFIVQDGRLCRAEGWEGRR